MSDSAIAPQFGATMRAHLADVESANDTALADAAAALFRTATGDGLIHVTGSGHSTGLVLEAFYRAGGLACVRPLSHPALSPLNGAMASTIMERTAGLGRKLAVTAAPGARDSLVVFSNSGVNAFPVEVAEACRAAGAVVIAVLSRPHMSRVPARAGAKLGEVADVVLDTRAPYGDAALTVGSTTVAGLSSLSSIFLWNLLLARLTALAADGGVELPVWRSANAAGGDQHNAALLERYRPFIPTL